MKKSVYERISRVIKDENDKEMLAVIEVENMQDVDRFERYVLGKSDILSLAEDIEDEYKDSERVGIYTITISNADFEDLYSETFEMNKDTFERLVRIENVSVVRYIDTIKSVVELLSMQNSKYRAWNKEEFERMRLNGVGLVYRDGDRYRIDNINVNACLTERNNIQDCDVIFLVKQFQNAVHNVWKVTPYSCNNVTKTVNKLKMIYG